MNKWTKYSVLAITLMSFCYLGRLSAAASLDLEGNWQGTLKVEGVELRLVLHISKDKGGGLSAAFDSIDQPGSNGIPVTSISFKDSKLTFQADSIKASYEGSFSADGTAIKGTWTQGRQIPLDFMRVVTAPKTGNANAKPSDIDGAWAGTIDAGPTKLRLVFHLTNTADGLTATMDSPDQGVNGIPVTAVTRNGPSVILELKQIGGKFEGKVVNSAITIEGTWSQGGVSQPLVLKRVTGASELQRRPQNPVPPFPYREEDVAYINPAGKIKLAATLTIPKGLGPFCGVVLITGSGPQDRDESILGHKPFLVLSDYLTRRGIEVLRADDRGFGKSGGTFATATTADFATDTEAGVAYLKTRPEVDPSRIGLIGHSEGGVIAPMVAARNPDVAFIVMMAGSGVRGEDVIVAQSQSIAGTNAPDERKLLDIVNQETDDNVLETRLRQMLVGKVPDAQIDASLKQLTSPWFRYFIAYDPAVALSHVKCPVLAMIGEKDLQVAPKQNLPAIRKALESGGNKNFEVDEMKGLNHLFQTAKTGAISEYSEIEETISPMALDKVTAWILKL